MAVYESPKEKLREEDLDVRVGGSFLLGIGGAAHRYSVEAQSKVLV